MKYSVLYISQKIFSPKCQYGYNYNFTGKSLQFIEFKVNFQTVQLGKSSVTRWVAEFSPCMT